MFTAVGDSTAPSAPSLRGAGKNLRFLTGGVSYVRCTVLTTLPPSRRSACHLPQRGRQGWCSAQRIQISGNRTFAVGCAAEVLTSLNNHLAQQLQQKMGGLLAAQHIYYTKSHCRLSMRDGVAVRKSVFYTNTFLLLCTILRIEICIKL